ncbi:hypothetical protein [Sagittula salina]|uniref:Uncharacterized protein n=1 Tax=Sagittula salina TaxID=2820268 RepID=A0A940MLR5_9RHOB|nr:hypothetical protein [Sagittula salina]MBP0481036.1 hypothetical protein [Sagittula salina]
MSVTARRRAAERAAVQEVTLIEGGFPIPLTPANPGHVPVHAVLTRFVLICLGFGLTASAFGIWIVAGGPQAADLMLMKLGASLVMLIAGMCMLVFARDNNGR